jgi:hypothetical protein
MGESSPVSRIYQVINPGGEARFVKVPEACFLVMVSCSKIWLTLTELEN